MRRTLILLGLLFMNVFGFSIIINIPADYPSIQEGLDVAQEGDSVLVAAGTYYENIIWPETNGIRLIGSSEEDCIIDGNQECMVIHYEHWDTFHDSTTVVKNFTIQNGWWTRGSGIHLRSDNQILLENLIVKNNYQFYPNDSDINENMEYSVEGGAGIHLDNHSSPIMRNILITGNYAESKGGGLFMYMSSEPIVENITITNNISAIAGGGICCEDGSYSNIVNCILWDNFPQEIYTYNASLNVTHSDIQGGWAGEGNIDENPLFVNYANGDYHLTIDSPCIDAGDPVSPFDPDGTISDMGAYYFDQTVITDENLQSSIFNYQLSNYPNPFNPSTTISFEYSNERNQQNEQVRIEIFNLKGQKIDQLQITNYELGINEVTWNAEGFTSGIYFYKLVIDNKPVVKRKMILLK